MDEKVFMSEGGVTVTSSRFIVSSQTYAMSGITSVKNSTKYPSRTGPIVLGILGGVMLANSSWYGAIPLGLAVLWWISQKVEFHVLLTTAAGEMEALSGEDQEFTSRVVKALSDAIVFRG